MLWILLSLKKLTFLVCPPGLFISVFPSIQNRKKRLPYFPQALTFDDGISCILFVQLRCLGFLGRNGLLMYWSPLSNSSIEALKTGFRQN